MNSSFLHFYFIIKLKYIRKVAVFVFVHILVPVFVFAHVLVAVFVFVFAHMLVPVFMFLFAHLFVLVVGVVLVLVVVEV